MASAAAGGLTWRLVVVRLPRSIDRWPSTHRLLALFWILASLLAILQIGQLSAFMDGTRSDGFSPVLEPDAYYSRYSSLTAYVHATTLARARVSNIYDIALYNGRSGPFKVDQFLLPPPSLLPIQATEHITRDFFSVRRLWFVLGATAAIAAAVALGAWVEPDAAMRLIALCPLLLLAPPIVLTHQIGNYQAPAIALALLGMVWIERRHSAIGGAALAFATAAKVFPGILIVWLLATRRWRAVAWTAAFLLLLAGLSAATVGVAPFREFLDYTLGRLAAGNAFANFEETASINQSVFGFVQKLQAIGVSAMTRDVGAMLSWAYTVTLLVTTALIAIRGRRTTHANEAARWLALLNLASFRSPFLPDLYGMYGTVWLLIVLSADRASTRRDWMWAGSAFVALSIVQAPWINPIPVPAIMILALVQQVCLVVVNLFALADRRLESAPVSGALHARG
jgi:hypothetical protein